MGANTQIKTDQSLILFDGVCNLCNGAVNFIIDHDAAGRFKFASLQSATGQQYLRSAGLSLDTYETMILVDQGQLYFKSTAALKIARHLNGWWSTLHHLSVIPRWIRDGVYAMIARYRYQIFGKQDYCRVPTADLRQRFVDAL